MAPDEGNLLIVPIPALVSILIAKRDAKGAALTESEVIMIRDKMACIVMPRDVARKLADKRGYDDIDPENVWAYRRGSESAI